MHARTLDMLHDTRNVHMLSITDRIDLHFLTDDIFINQNWCIMADFLYCRCHIDTQIVIVVYDFHRTSAQYIGWTHQYRISDTVGDAHRFLYLYCGFPLRLRDVQLMQHFLKFMAILCTVDVFQRGSQDFNTALHQLISQIDGRLSAKLHHNAQRLFQINDMHDILNRQRFKVQLIGNRIIR